MATRRVGQVGQLLGSYVAIVLIGIITLFPIYWIVSTSIKKPDDILASPPRGAAAVRPLTLGAPPADATDGNP